MTQRHNLIEGEYMVFVLGREEYGIPLHKVREVLGPEDIHSHEPNEACVTGMIKIHNQMVPILDLYCRFGLPSNPEKEDGAVLITSFGSDGVMVGLLVDSIREVIQIEANFLETTMIPQDDPRSEFVVGLAAVEERVIHLLNLEKRADLLPAFSPV
jgi:purine-binding chemotaxis protein CheW